MWIWSISCSEKDIISSKTLTSVRRQSWIHFHPLSTLWLLFASLQVVEKEERLWSKTVLTWLECCSLSLQLCFCLKAFSLAGFSARCTLYPQSHSADSITAFVSLLTHHFIGEAFSYDLLSITLFSFLFLHCT